jgi:hypothetical protein
VSFNSFGYLANFTRVPLRIPPSANQLNAKKEDGHGPEPVCVGTELLACGIEPAQVDAMLKVADTFYAKGEFGTGNRDRIRAMILQLRYSGLRISDATVLERSRLSGDKLFL